MLPLVWNPQQPGLLTGTRGGGVCWASVDWAVVDLGSALLGQSRCSRGQAVDSGGETSGGGIGGGCQGVALLPMVPLEVVLQGARLSTRIVTVGTFVGSLT